MNLSFDERRWSELEECLKVGGLCASGANDLYGHAKGVLQRTLASLSGDKEVEPSEAEHAVNILGVLRHSAHDAAAAFAVATARIDELMAQLTPAPGRARGRATKS